MEAYCVKCKAKVQIKDPEEVTKEVKGNPRKFTKGTCPNCGTSVWRVMPKN